MTTDYGPGVIAAIQAHAPHDTRIADVETAHMVALVEDVQRERHQRLVDAVLDKEDDGPGRDQHGRHDAPTAMQQMVDTMAAQDSGMVGPAYSVDSPSLDFPTIVARVAGELAKLASFGPDAQTWVDAQIEADHTPTVAGYVEHLRGLAQRPPVVGMDARLRMGEILVHFQRGRIDGAEAMDQLIATLGAEPAAEWTPWLPLSAGELERLLCDTTVRIEAQDSRDEETPHPLSVGDCDGGDCEMDSTDDEGDEGEVPRCVLLLSAAFVSGALHCPADAPIEVRIGAQA
jgi:hypothetical protein